VKRTLRLLALLPALAGGVDLGTVDVRDAGAERSESEAGFADVFTAPEYVEQRSYLPDAPAQKRLTSDEAMFVPGVQGDPLKALKSLSGITSLSDMTGELYIYGSKPQESQFSLNHLPIGYVYHMFGIHSVISPDAIEQIDAYLGGFDVTYGDAMGGVIDITPRYPTGSDTGFVHAGIYDASAGMDVAISDDLSLFVGARRSYFDLFLDAVGKTTGTLDEESNTTYTQFPNYWDATALLDYRIGDGHALSVEMLAAGDGLTIRSYENAVKDPEATGTIGNSSGFVSGGVRHRFEGVDYSTQTLAYYNYTYSDTELFTDYYMRFESQRYGLFHQSDYEAGEHLLSFGLEANHLDIPLDLNISRPPSPTDPDFDFTTEQKIRVDETIRLDTLALFAQDTWHLTDDLSLRYGVRYSSSDYQGFRHLLDPRAAAVYRLNGSDALSLSVGRYSQMPEGFKTQQDFGSTSLTFEHSMHYMLAYNHVDKDMEWSLQPFYKKFTQLAIDVLDTNGTTEGYGSTGRGDAYGLDVSAKYRDGRYYAFIAYTYLNARRQADTNDSTMYPFYGDIPHTLQMLGSVRFGGDWAFSVLTKYSSGKPYTPVVGTYTDATGRVRPVYGTLFSERLPAYFTLNLKIAQQIALGGDEQLTWSFELMNATNHENVTGIRYDDNYNVKGYMTQLPLLPWFDVTYRF